MCFEDEPSPFHLLHQVNEIGVRKGSIAGGRDGKTTLPQSNVRREPSGPSIATGEFRAGEGAVEQAAVGGRDFGAPVPFTNSRERVVPVASRARRGEMRPVS